MVRDGWIKRVDIVGDRVIGPSNDQIEWDWMNVYGMLRVGSD